MLAANDIAPPFMEEMQTTFVTWTLAHIELVKQNLLRMEGYEGLSLVELTERAIEHDQSKFSEEEREGYIWLTWMYQNRAVSQPNFIRNRVEKSLQRHRQSNRHHPEAHSNPNDMSLLDLVEMVCDWTAVAQQIGESSALAWARANIKRWPFSAASQEKVFNIIDELDRRIGFHATHPGTVGSLR